MFVSSRQVLACLSVLVFSWTASAQVLRPVRPFSTEGVVKSLERGRMSMTDRTGKVWQLYFSTRGDGRLALPASRVFVARPPRVTVVGDLPHDMLEPGMAVQFDSHMHEKSHAIRAALESVKWVDESGFKPGVQVNRKRKNDRGDIACRVSGHVDSLRSGRLTLRVPRSRFANKGKLTVRLTPEARVQVEGRSLSRARPGDRVTSVTGVELNSGDLVIQNIEVRLSGKTTAQDDKPKRKTARDPEPIAARYETLSTEPVPPRIVRNQFYVLHTDLSERDAQMLLDKLAEMLRLLVGYYGRPQPGPLECYVVRDLEAWPANQFPDGIREKISAKEGMTHSVQATSSQGLRRAKVTVYAAAKPDVVKHEAVHGYHRLAFGEVGPSWYAEGMAELGQYWKASQPAVDVDPRTIKYFKKAETPRSIKQILSAKEITGDTWVEYNWRWALCHLLANNPNYARSFKELGLGMLLKKKGVSFSKTYGKVAKQLMFEYKQFVANVENGYRCDLCAWPWKQKPASVSAKDDATVRVSAKAGWQTAIQVEADVEYAFDARGQWEIDGTGTTCTADGHQEKNGALTAALFADYALDEPILLSAGGKLKFPKDGTLYLRCGEPWGRLGDNSGTITVRFSRTSAP